MTSPWRWMFVIGAVPALLALVIRRRLKEPEQWEKASHDGAVAKQLGSYAELFRDPRWKSTPCWDWFWRARGSSAYGQSDSSLRPHPLRAEAANRHAGLCEQIAVAESDNDAERDPAGSGSGLRAVRLAGATLAEVTADHQGRESTR